MNIQQAVQDRLDNAPDLAPWVAAERNQQAEREIMDRLAGWFAAHLWYTEGVDIDPSELKISPAIAGSSYRVIYDWRGGFVLATVCAGQDWTNPDFWREGQYRATRGWGWDQQADFDTFVDAVIYAGGAKSVPAPVSWWRRLLVKLGRG